MSSFLIALCFLSGGLRAAGMTEPLRQTIDRIVSRHILIRIPQEREWLGRETIMELERYYLFIDRTTGGKLPARVLVSISWDERESGIRQGEASITVGMNNPAAAADSRGYLLHNAAKEIARLALLELSKGGAGRAENRFLLEGMTEILAREYEQASRSLGAAWVRCHFMDRIEPLSLSTLASWDRFSNGRQDQRAASPGITFLLTCREMSNRESLLKLFENMRKRSLPESLAEVFKSAAAALESRWLERIRAYQVAEDLTVSSDEDAPKLERTAFDPEAGVPGEELLIRVFIRDRSNDLFAGTVFFEERESRGVLSAQAPREAAAKYLQFRLPVAQDRKSGRYDYRLIAVDEAGNVRIWPGAYPVLSR